MNKKLKFATIGAGIVAAVTLLATQPKTNAEILNDDLSNNIVYIYTDAEGTTVIGVQNTKSIDEISQAMQKRGDKKVQYVQTAPFYANPPFSTENDVLITIKSNVKPYKYNYYLPMVARDITLSWDYDNRGGRFRPVPGGVSCGHPDITTGTCGAPICYKGNCNCMLSNAHVFAGFNDAKIGDAIIQPGRYPDGGTLLDEFAKLAYFALPKSGVTNTIDAAIACGTSSTIHQSIYGIGNITGVEFDPQVGTKMTKCGRRTGCTILTLAAKDVTVKVFYYITNRKMISMRFEHQYLFEGESDGGDSGSLIVTQDGKLAALLFAGGEGKVLANPIDLVLKASGANLP